MICTLCGDRIPPERMQALPATTTCVGCADKNTSGRRGFLVYEHKTAPTFVMIEESNREAIRIAERANRRAR
jgi:hypothetical protein